MSKVVDNSVTKQSFAQPSVNGDVPFAVPAGRSTAPVKVRHALIGRIRHAARGWPRVVGTVLAALTAFVTLAMSDLGAGTASASPLASSPNWAGYVATGETYTYVYGSWTVPKANCGTIFSHFTFASDSSTWVGLDGWNSSTVEQIGTDTNCIANQGAYWAWFQMYPSLPTVINIFSYPVHPGDTMNGMVIYTGTPGWYTLRLWDTTRHWYYQTTQYRSGAAGANAEWITEQPAVLSFPLTNFGTVTFTSCYAGGSNASAYNTPISHHTNFGVNMVGGGTVKATVSGLSSDGTTFSIGWQHN
jgi:hypothetical protein